MGMENGGGRRTSFLRSRKVCPLVINGYLGNESLVERRSKQILATTLENEIFALPRFSCDEDEFPSLTARGAGSRLSGIKSSWSTMGNMSGDTMGALPYAVRSFVADLPPPRAMDGLPCPVEQGHGRPTLPCGAGVGPWIAYPALWSRCRLQGGASAHVGHIGHKAYGEVGMSDFAVRSFVADLPPPRAMGGPALEGLHPYLWSRTPPVEHVLEALMSADLSAPAITQACEVLEALMSADLSAAAITQACVVLETSGAGPGHGNPRFGQVWSEQNDAGPPGPGEGGIKRMRGEGPTDGPGMGPGPGFPGQPGMMPPHQMGGPPGHFPPPGGGPMHPGGFEEGGFPPGGGPMSGEGMPPNFDMPREGGSFPGGGGGDYGPGHNPHMGRDVYRERARQRSRLQ
eukprot:gene7676-834_t